ncbi:MAG: hypothetical protein MZV63_50460 [Marinilabiliales bacterium]|nr:hypothetical protein [Marinilabiliales bacterium]
MRVFNEDGLMPQEAYSGISYDSPIHNHRELQAYIDAADSRTRQNETVSAQESDEVTDAVLDIYLGEVPESFTYKGQTYTPKSFAASLGLEHERLCSYHLLLPFPILHARECLRCPTTGR